MATGNYSDLHCHPGLRSINMNKTTLWDTHRGKKARRIIRAQLKGKRGALYDQSGYPKLANGQVKLVFASLYPLEQGFMMNNNLFLDTLNIPFKIGVWFSFLFNRFRKNIHLRDYFLSLFINFSSNRIRDLKNQEYWDGFMDEYIAYRTENNLAKDISKKSVEEIKELIRRRHKDFPEGYAARTSGVYQIADGNWDGKLPADDKILTVLNIEGIGIISQVKEGGPTKRHGTRMQSETEIFKRLNDFKTKIPLFYITFSHHFASGLCGHARSIPDIARDLGILHQEYFIDQNFSELGYRILQYLLSVKVEGGTWVRDEGAGRRILIDVKHMSLRGRLTLYQLVKLYNDGKEAKDKIPVIASHVGFSGRTVGQMLSVVNRRAETSRTQIQTTRKFGRLHTYNTWSINLGVEEIGWIVESDGLIGISMEQNNLGIGFGKKTRKKQPYFAHLVMNQILDMAKAAATPKFWNHITLGTDFDGLIDPIDHYTSSLFFHGLKQDLAAEFHKLSTPELVEASLDIDDLNNILERLFIGNAMSFIQRHFKTADMPMVQAFA